MNVLMSCGSGHTNFAAKSQFVLLHPNTMFADDVHILFVAKTMHNPQPESLSPTFCAPNVA